MHSNTAFMAVAASAPVTAVTTDSSEALLSLGLGLLGVAFARQIFINREKRTTGRSQAISEHLPLTLAAMLIAGVFIWDRQLSFSFSVLTGLGVGWTAIILLDVIGAGVLRALRRVFGVEDGQ